MLPSSGLFHQLGDVEPVTSVWCAGRRDAAIAAYQAHPVLMDYVLLTPATRGRLNELADLQAHVSRPCTDRRSSGTAAPLRSAADMLQRRFGAVPVDAQPGLSPSG